MHRLRGRRGWKLHPAVFHAGGADAGLSAAGARSARRALGGGHSPAARQCHPHSGAGAGGHWGDRDCGPERGQSAQRHPAGSAGADRPAGRGGCHGRARDAGPAGGGDPSGAGAGLPGAGAGAGAGRGGDAGHRGCPAAAGRAAGAAQRGGSDEPVHARSGGDFHEPGGHPLQGRCTAHQLPATLVVRAAETGPGRPDGCGGAAGRRAVRLLGGLWRLAAEARFAAGADLPAHG